MTGAVEPVVEPAIEPAADNGAAADSPPVAKSPPLMLVRLGPRWFGIDTRMIGEVAIKGAVTRVPTAPRHVLGVTSLRGNLVPVISLEQMVGGSGPVARDMTATLPRLVVVQAGEYEIAVVVDEIRGITDEVVPLGGTALDGDRPAFMCEEVSLHGEAVCLIDVPLLIATAAGQVEGGQ
jgi:chemotaxis signal transduction protein